MGELGCIQVGVEWGLDEGRERSAGRVGRRRGRWESWLHLQEVVGGKSWGWSREGREEGGG